MERLGYLWVAKFQGNSTSPWGETTGKTCRVELTGNVLDLADWGRGERGKWAEPNSWTIQWLRWWFQISYDFMYRFLIIHSLWWFNIFSIFTWKKYLYVGFQHVYVSPGLSGGFRSVYLGIRRWFPHKDITPCKNIIKHVWLLAAIIRPETN